MQMIFKTRLLYRSAFFAAWTLAFALPTLAQSASVPSRNQETPAATQSAADRKDLAQPDSAGAPTASNPEELRIAQIQADTKRLYQLALELRTEVGKTYKQSLSLTVLKKAEELEKLAKNLRSEMNREATAEKP